MPPSILLTVSNLCPEERKDLYDTYLEKRCRAIFLRPYSREDQLSKYYDEVRLYANALEVDIDNFNRYDFRFGEEAFRRFKRHYFVDLRLMRLTEICNEYNIMRRLIRWSLIQDNEGYMLFYQKRHMT